MEERNGERLWREEAGYVLDDISWSWYVIQKQLNILHNELTHTKIQYETLKKAKDARKKSLVTCKRSPVRLSDLSSGILEFQRQWVIWCIWSGKKKIKNFQPRIVCLDQIDVQLHGGNSYLAYTGSWVPSGRAIGKGKRKRVLYLTELDFQKQKEDIYHQVWLPESTCWKEKVCSC